MAEDISPPAPPQHGQEAAEHPAPATTPRTSLPSLSLQIWPPTQRTRDAVTSRLVENLSSPSVVTKRYGAVPLEEASTFARRIEEEAFAAASAAAAAEESAGSVDEGIEVLQIYSREISKRVLETVKSRPLAAAAAAESAPSPAAAVEEGSEAVAESQAA